VYSLTVRIQHVASDSLCRHLREWLRLPFTARIERAHSYRARSASKKGTWPPPLTLPRPRVARARGVIGSPHHPKGPFREAMERRALPPRLRFVYEFPLRELTPSAERRSLLLALEPHKEDSPWGFNRYRIGH